MELAGAPFQVAPRPLCNRGRFPRVEHTLLRPRADVKVIAAASLRDAGRPDDVDPEGRSERRDPFQVGRLGRGRWDLQTHGRLGGRSTGPQSATLRLEVSGVTSREREVAALLAGGLSDPEIAENLVLSPHTVQDHIKSLYDKLEVSSRQELVARVFLDEYLPEVAVQTPITSRGRFELDDDGDGQSP
jgi:DNA-binding CsgD family transcriptional regulator